MAALAAGRAQAFLTSGRSSWICRARTTIFVRWSRQFERDTRRTKWLLKRLGDKIRHFPRDLSRRLRASRRKRQPLASGMPVASSLRVDAAAIDQSAEFRAATSMLKSPTPLKAPAPLFQILDGRRDELIALRRSDPGSEAMLRQMEDFAHSPLMRQLVAKAAAIDPEVGRLAADTPSFCAPWHDGNYEAVQARQASAARGPIRDRYSGSLR